MLKRSCNIFTFMCAVSHVKGGKGCAKAKGPHSEAGGDKRGGIMAEGCSIAITGGCSVAGARVGRLGGVWSIMLEGSSVRRSRRFRRYSACQYCLSSLR